MPGPMQGACPQGKQERQEARQEGPQAAVWLQEGASAPLPRSISPSWAGGSRGQRGLGAKAPRIRRAEAGPPSTSLTAGCPSEASSQPHWPAPQCCHRCLQRRAVCPQSRAVGPTISVFWALKGRKV